MDEEIEESFSTKFLLQLRRNKIVGSFNVAKHTAELLRRVIESRNWKNAKEMLDTVQKLGKKLIEAKPLELAIGNVVKRVLFLIREEYSSRKTGKATPFLAPQPSLTNLLSKTQELDDFSKPINIKQNVLGSIDEFIEEISSIYVNIADQAIEHIHTNEMIMTLGKSQTVEKFLKAAAKKRKFEVIVVEAAPFFMGHETAMNLSKLGIETTLITDSAIFAMMARVNKVIVGTHAVMANGGLLAPSGMHMLALAAKYHSVPFVVCVGLYKLSPLYPYEQDALSFNALHDSCSILSYEEEAAISKEGIPIEVYNPSYDYIPPELISLFVTNFGGHNPSYIYRLLAEYYHPDDSF